MALFKTGMKKESNRVAGTPQLTIDEYEQKINQFPQGNHPISSEKGKELEELLYQVMTLQDGYTKGSKEYQRCEDISASIVGKLEGIV